MLYVPEGCAHGFLTLADATEVFYQISAAFQAEARGVRWNDPAFGVEWMCAPDRLERDRHYPDFPADDARSVQISPTGSALDPRPDPPSMRCTPTCTRSAAASPAKVFAQRCERFRKQSPSIHEVPTGTPVFDWIVPREWNIREAYIKNAAGERVVDFRDCNLHVVDYSGPSAQASAGPTTAHLFTLPDRRT